MAMTSIPATSSAVNIQIIEPKNFAGGATPGQISSGNPYQGGVNTYGNTGGATNYGQQINPYAAPQQQLQQAFQQAQDAKVAADQARNSYYNLANQLNTQAYQQNTANPYNYQYPQYNIYNAGYPQGYGQQAQQAQQQQYQPYPYQQQAQQPYNMPINQPFLPNYGPQFPPANQQAYQYPYNYQQQQQQYQPEVPNANQLPPDQQQQPVDQAPVEEQQPQEPQGPDYATMPVEQLNQILANPQSIQEKVDVIEQVAMRGQANPETFKLLEQEALLDTSGLPDNNLRQQADYVREAAIWSLGLLNQTQHAQTPTAQLPGLSAFDQIAKSKNESDIVKAAVAQSLGLMGRENDKQVKKILKKLAKNKNAVSGAIAKDILDGKGLQLQGMQ